MANSDRITILQSRLTKIQAAIAGTLDRNAASYQINGRSLSSFSLDQLIKLETATENEIKRLQRGSRFGGIGFKRVTA